MGLADNADRAGKAFAAKMARTLPKEMSDSDKKLKLAKASADAAKNYAYNRQTAVNTTANKPTTTTTTTKPKTTKPKTTKPATTTTTTSGGSSGGSGGSSGGSGGSSGGSGGSAGVSSVPEAPAPTPIRSEGDVKPATPDIVRAVSEIPVPADQMASIILNDIGGQELISIARSDIINGQNIIYEPLSDAKELSKAYNPNNIIYLSETLDKIFNSFSIKLNSKIPTSAGNNVSFADNKIVIQLKDIQKDELVEVQVVSSGTLLDDTIYTGE